MVLLLALTTLVAGDALATQYYWVAPLPDQIPGGAKRIDSGLALGADELVALDNYAQAWSYDGINKTWSRLPGSGWKYLYLTRTVDPKNEIYLYLIDQNGSIFGMMKNGTPQQIPAPVPFNALAGYYLEFAVDNEDYAWKRDIANSWNKIKTVNSIEPRGDQIIAPVYQQKIIDGSKIYLVAYIPLSQYYTFSSFSDPGFLVMAQPAGWWAWNLWNPAGTEFPIHLRTYNCSNFPDGTFSLIDHIGVISKWDRGTWKWESIPITQPWIDMATIDYDNIYLISGYDGSIWHGEVFDDSVPCANRLLGNKLSATGSTMGRNSSGYSTCGGYGGDFTYLWTAPRSGTYVFNTVGSNFDTVLYLKTVCSGAPVRCDDDSGGNLTSRLEYTVNQGDKLLITVDGYGPSSQGNYKLNIRQKGYECADIDIDDMANAAIGSSTAAAANRVTSNCGGAGPDVTFLWRAPESGVYVFDTQGSKFDTVLSLRSTCGGLVLKCDDDSGGNTTSKLEYAVTKGKLYLITVDGYYATSKGNYNLRILKK